MTQPGESACHTPDQEVGRPIRRIRLRVEVVYVGDWEDVEARVLDDLNDRWPNAALSIDTEDEVQLG